MSETVKMPALGESVTEGTVTQWLKQVGDTVEVDEPLLEVSTDKVDTEIPSPVAGVIEKILVEEDEDAEVGADLVVIGDGSGTASEDAGDGDSSSEAAESTETPQEETADAPAEAVSSSEDSAPMQESESGPAEGTEVTMPALGESVTEGTVTQWLKAVGDEVEVDEPLLEVSTDKVDTEIPSPVAGTLLEIRVEEDEDAAVGAVVAVIGDKNVAPTAQSAPADQRESEETEDTAPQEQAPAEEPEGEPEAAPEEQPAHEKPAASSPRSADVKPQATSPAPQAANAVSGSDSTSGYVTPLVRRLAGDAGIDLADVKGTGLGGRVRKQDVQAAIEAAQASSATSVPDSGAAAPAASADPVEVEVSPLRGTEEKMSRLRKVVAQRMVESLHTQAQLTTAVEVDMTRVATLRAASKAAFQEKHGAKLTFLPFIMQAVVEGLQTYPQINAEIKDDKIVYHGHESLGMAADTERGLVVPVIKNANELGLPGIAGQVGELAGKARGNKLTPDDLSGATFTITNTGSGGALWDTPIVPNPQVAILGTGAIVKRPVVLTDPEGQDSIAIRQMMYLFLSYDHRLVDGADAARFLTYLKKRLEEGRFEANLDL